MQELAPAAEWNPLNRLPMSGWLCEHRDEEDKERMRQCGNLVVPQQATYAWKILMDMVLRNDSPLVRP